MNTNTGLESLSALGRAARNDPSDPKTLRAVAGQFEALLTQMLLKSMREATPGDPLLGSSGQHYRELFDREIALKLSTGRGLGLADALVKQLKSSAEAPITVGRP